MAKRLYDVLKNCKKEEEVKAEFLKFFKQRINALNLIDHYTPEILFEFKLNKDFSKKHNVAYVVAQTMYYIRKIKYSSHSDFIGISIPPYACVIDKNEGFFFETKCWRSYYEHKSSSKYDWDRAASTPCPKLVSNIEKDSLLDSIVVYDFSIESEEKHFVELYRAYSFKTSLDLIERKSITEDNFWYVFRDWNKKFGGLVKNGHSPAEYFLSDIEKGNTIKLGEDSYAFKMSNDNLRQKRIPSKIYDAFWLNYERLRAHEVPQIRQRKAILADDFERRLSGEYYTPIEFAEKGLEYLQRVIGPEWWKNGDYRLWDMAAGTGNLELRLPSSALQYCYLSSIENDDVEYCKRIYPQATVFQYDYLNDDIDYLFNKTSFASPKMPRQLVKDLNNPNIKWIVLLNPPYKVATNAETRTSMKTWDGVSRTSIRECMALDNLLEVSREVYMQFLYRIFREFDSRSVVLCLYSTLKYMNSNNDQKARDSFLRMTYKAGFMFDAKCFYQAKGGFPVAYAIWDMSKPEHIENQCIQLDVFGYDASKIGTKTITMKPRTEMLNKWVPRYRNTHVRPPFSSAFKLSTVEHTDVRDRAADGYLFTAVSQSDKMEAQNRWCLMSTVYTSAGGFSVTPENFERALVLHTVKKIPKSLWTNNGDSFYAPICDLPQEFVTDCVIWSIFADSNNAVALKNVEYKDSLYQIENQLFPFSLKELRTWDISDSSISLQIATANEDRYTATWINNQTLSIESQKVMNAARKLYSKIFSNFSEIDWATAKIDTWDFGLMQIKSALNGTSFAREEFAELKKQQFELRRKLLPKIYEYGFLDEDVKYYEVE